MLPFSDKEIVSEKCYRDWMEMEMETILQSLLEKTDNASHSTQFFSTKMYLVHILIKILAKFKILTRKVLLNKVLVWLWFD